MKHPFQGIQLCTNSRANRTVENDRLITEIASDVGKLAVLAATFFAGWVATPGAAALMPHVNIFEPRTWTDGDEAGHILQWAEVEEIVAGDRGAR